MRGTGVKLHTTSTGAPPPRGLRMNYIVGVPQGGYWREIANSDATLYGGSGIGNLGGIESAPVAAHGRFHSLAITLPPLAVLMFKCEA